MDFLGETKKQIQKCFNLIPEAFFFFQFVCSNHTEIQFIYNFIMHAMKYNWSMSIQ